MTWLIHLAWKNLWRNKWRTAISVTAVSFAVVFSTAAESLKQGIFDNLIKNVVGFYTGAVQLHRQGYYDEQILDNGFELTADLKSRFEHFPGITGAAFRLESFMLVSKADKTMGCLVTGISPGAENLVTRLGSRVIAGQYTGEADRAVLMGSGLASRLGVTVNDSIVLFGQGYHGALSAGKYPVKGILQFGTPALNDKYLALPLSAAMDLFDAPGIVTGCIFSIEETADAEKMAASIGQWAGGDFEVMSWSRILPEIKQHIDTDSSNLRIFQIVLYFLIGFGIFSTMLMLMIERRFETGMLVAIGMKKSKLALMFIFESVLTVMTGCLLGILISIPVIYSLHKNPLRLSGETAKAYERFGFEPIFPAAFHEGIFLLQAFIVFLLGMILAFYPVVKVALLKPVLAMKK